MQNKTERRGAIKRPCYAIIGSKVVRYETLTAAAVQNDFEFWQLSVARIRAIDAGDTSFTVDGMTFFLIEPVVIGAQAAVHIRVAPPRTGGALLPGLVTHGLAQLWR